MMSRTISEEMFEELCLKAGAPCCRVAEKVDAKRPDYEVEFAGERIVTEVKQFDPNDEEAGGIGGITITPGDRIRKAIRRAAPQLKALSKGECPAMLVVYNNSGAKNHTDPYSVATAMQGLDVIPVLVPEEPSISPQFQDARSGPGKKMTANANTTISALGVLRTDFDAELLLCIYHNSHARHPIDPEWIRHPRVHHFRLPGDEASSLGGWESA